MYKNELRTNMLSKGFFIKMYKIEELELYELFILISIEMKKCER